MQHEHYILHQFRPLETIDAVMRLKGRHDYTREELRLLRLRFNVLNGPVVPRVGDIYKIPLEQIVVDDYGTVVDVSVLFPVEPDPAREREEPTNGDHAGDPREPDRKLPTEPKPRAPVEDTPKQDGDQQVPPDPSERPGQEPDGPEMQPAQAPTLAVSGSRRLKR